MSVLLPYLADIRINSVFFLFYERIDYEMRDLISSLHSKSTALNKLLPIKLCGSTVLGLVDSGNSFYNAISLAVANKIGLSDFDHYTGPPVGTTLVGSTLDIVGIVSNINFGLIDESGWQHLISSRLVIVRHLSCGLKILFPSWLKTDSINFVLMESSCGQTRTFDSRFTET